jgi:hypothetical protein
MCTAAQRGRPRQRRVVVGGVTGPSVIDALTDTVVGTIGGFDTPDGVAVDSLTDQIYVTTDKDVQVIDGATDALNAVIITRIGLSPIGIADDPTTGTVYVANEGLRRLRPLANSSDQPRGPWPVGGPPNARIELTQNPITARANAGRRESGGPDGPLHRAEGSRQSLGTGCRFLA